jgi:hypothetical protein
MSALFPKADTRPVALVEQFALRLAHTLAALLPTSKFSALIATLLLLAASSCARVSPRQKILSIASFISRRLTAMMAMQLLRQHATQFIEIWLSA